MAKLRLKLHGKDVSVIDLVDGQEYISGRSQDCQIPLANQKVSLVTTSRFTKMVTIGLPN